MQKRYVIPILPKAWVLFTHNSPLFYIPEVCRSLHMVTKNPEDKGLPCPMYSTENPYCFHLNDKEEKVFHTLSKDGRRNKQTIERYNKYRVDLYHLCKQLNFQVQSSGMAIYYHFPVPARWNKKKKAEMHGQLKASKSDCTNLQKGFEDALTGKDEVIGQYSGSGKFWFQPEKVAPELQQGYIEILTGMPVYNPYSVELKNIYLTVEMEDIESRRAKLKSRKEELKKQREEEEKKTVKKKRKVKPLKLDDKQLFKKEDKIK